MHTKQLSKNKLGGQSTMVLGFIFVVTSVLSGCDSVLSVYPLGIEDDPRIVKDDRLVGTWYYSYRTPRPAEKHEHNVERTLLFDVQESTGKKYTLTCYESPKDGDSPWFTCSFTILKGSNGHYIDIQGRDGFKVDRPASSISPLSISGHFIARVEISDKSISLFPLDKVAVQRAVEGGDVDFEYTRDDRGNVVLTTSSKRLQAVLFDTDKLLSTTETKLSRASAMSKP